MIQSMTGYGTAVAEHQGKKIHVEIKSLNSKSLDLSTRLAQSYREKEMDIRQYITQRLVRGKVDFTLWIEQGSGNEVATINAAAVVNYYKQIKTLAAENGIPEPQDWFATLLKMPEATTHNDAELLDDAEWEAAKTAIRTATDNLVAFRTQEGAALERKFEEKIDSIERLLHSIDEFEKVRVEKIKARILESLKAIPEAEYDKNRFEQELIYYIEKLDISEEKQRLANHLNYFRETMREPAGQGKKLGFISQEMGREINTTGSKSNNADMQNLVVKMKDELEQIKEQVLNAL